MGSHQAEYMKQLKKYISKFINSIKIHPSDELIEKLQEKL